MPVIQTAPGEWETWMDTLWAEAKALQRLLRAGNSGSGEERLGAASRCRSTGAGRGGSLPLTPQASGDPAFQWRTNMAKRSMSKAESFRLWLLIATAFSLVLAVLAGIAVFRVAEARTAGALDRSLMLTRSAVEAELERFRHLPALVLEDPRVREAIRRPEEAARNAASRYLQQAALHAGAAELYLIDANGTGIAASNWDEPGSVVGKKYQFRPYFLEAMSQGTGRFYGIGLTTGRPGYFLSSRLDLPTGETGVAVAKVELLPLQAGWRDAGAVMALGDRAGVIFLSSAPEWRYRPLVALSDDQRTGLEETRAYVGENPGNRPPILDRAALEAPRPRVTIDGQVLLLRRVELPSEGWTLVSAVSLAPAATLGWMAGIVVALALFAAMMAGQIYVQRRRLLRMRLRQSALLERRVQARTQQLAREVEVRKATEEELLAAQDALIHSEKMAALGRMSAAITHEISQPLAAMEASLAATIVSGKVTDEPTAKRIDTARGHIRRMQRTIKHLKSFSRKEAAELRPTSVDDAIRNAIDLVAPRAHPLPVRTVFHPDRSARTVIADLVLLEQVFVNLLVNALDALKECETPRLIVERRVVDGRVLVTVIDNGSGIPERILDRITEPFFTTKSGSEGLGLGLAITQTILEEFGGRLDVASRPGEETRVTVSLPERADHAVAAE